ncbi:MAG TPA: glycosyltransferase family 2 protein [Steroidobacteraceae bacterium]|nr:glycosyltransferase family 2 protein [Steroidobacteraceae bacterium]
MESRSDQPGTVRAVLVTYHPDAGLPRRLAAIAAQVAGIVIVDNGSNETQLAMLRGLAAGDPAVALLENGANLGVARALNLGIERAAQRDCRWLLLLDQDSTAEPDLVRALLAVHGAYPRPERLAIVGAAFLDPAAHAPPPAAARAPPRGADSAGGEPWRAVETAITSGSLLALAAYRAIGPFRDEFFIDYVDSDFCRRAHAHGFAVVITRRPLMAHTIGAPTRHRLLWMCRWTSNHSADRRYYIARNDTVMLREGGRHPHGRWALKSLARRLRTCKRVLLYEEAKAAKIAAVLQGWWHGIRGRMGPRPRDSRAR